MKNSRLVIEPSPYASLADPPRPFAPPSAPPRSGSASCGVVTWRPAPRAANDLHEVDLVGPIYLEGRSHRYYIWVGKDAFDGAVCLRLAESRRMDEVLWFLG